MCQTILFHCLVCSKQFIGSKHKANKFCSTECYRSPVGKSLTKKGVEKSLKGTCEHCGKDVFDCRGTGQLIFCNRECYDAHRVKAWQARATDCVNCGEKILGAGVSTGKQERKYCSNECRVEYKKPKPINCSVCNVLFSAIKYGKKKDGSPRYARVNDQKTCSRDCLAQFFRIDEARKEKISLAFSGDKHPAWLGGSHEGSGRGAGWNKIAEVCRERAGRKCEQCGKSEAENGRRLDVNHIIPFHQWQNKTKANAQSNLEALCKSCHTKTDHLWRKNNQVQLSLDIYR